VFTTEVDEMTFQSASTALDVSVIICTHNPRADYFARVLEALRAQTLPLDKWELLIVDNASQVPLASQYDISWHPAGRHISEPELGLAAARRCGIETAASDLIVFVDDDNVLNNKYLTEAVTIKEEYPFLGVWGSGSVRGEFEVDPAEEIRSWLPVRVEKGRRWSNLAGITLFGFSRDDAIPFGCGMCVRKEVALAYRKFCERGGIQITDRKGGALSGGGDTEICFVCCADGLGVGVFPLLELTHLIPQRRVSADYIVRFAEATALSNMLLLYKWQGVLPQSLFGARTLLSLAKTMLLHRGFERRTRLAQARALAKAHRIIKMDLRKKTGTESTT
jgi:glycosyltransferase involved in cell wall biosynthesis